MSKKRAGEAKELLPEHGGRPPSPLPQHSPLSCNGVLFVSFSPDFPLSTPLPREVAAPIHPTAP